MCLRRLRLARHDAAVELSWSMPACSGGTMQIVWHRKRGSSSVLTWSVALT